MKRKFCAAALAGALLLGTLSGCSGASSDGRQIIRIGHNQSTNHPTHIALVAFEDVNANMKVSHLAGFRS